MKFAAKVRVLGIVFAVLFSLILLRLFYWQVISFETLRSEADKQHFYFLEIPARRGEILAADEAPLAADKTTYLSYAHLPELTTDKGKLAEDLAKVMVLDRPLLATDGAEITAVEREKLLAKAQKDLEEDLLQKLASSSAPWINLAHFLSAHTRSQIEEHKIPGLGFFPEEARDYPEASMAAHLLGFVGFDSVGNPKGYFGLEGFYNRELAGQAGQIRAEKDALGRPIAIGTETKVDKKDGRDLVTTIDRSVQRMVERELEKGISDWKALGGTAIVMNPVDGAILAMASFPRFDPRYFSYYETQLFKNPAVADLYEPGSIIKPLVMAAAVNEGKVKPETRCDKCSGPRVIGDATIHTFNDQYHPNLDMGEVLINSDNTGMVFVGEKLGFDKFYSYFGRFGLSEKSGMDLEDEQWGVMREKRQYYPIDQATITFGQGINISAIQLMRAWATLANGGRLVTPHVVSKIRDERRIINVNWPSGKQILTKKTAEVITEMLIRVAKESPVHYPLDRVPELSRFAIAAKSGTAQIAVGGKYRERGTIASVIGFFPAKNPRFLIMVKLNEPEVRPWGSDTAGPVFFAIIKDLVSYYGIAP